MARFNIYRNLHKAAWSIRLRGRVIEHVSSCTALGVDLHIGESTRLKSRDRGQRSVHAWVKADSWKHGNHGPADNPTGSLRYDWSRPDGFIDGKTGEPVTGPLRAVHFCSDGYVRYWK